MLGMGGSGEYDVTAYIIVPEGESGNAAGEKLVELCKDMECTVSYSGMADNMTQSMTGNGISLRVYGNDMTDLQTAAKSAAEALRSVEGVRSVSDGLSGAVPAESLTGTSGAVPLSPRAAVEQVYDAAVKAGKGGSVVINAVPAAQSVKSGKVGALRELTQDELSAYLDDSAVQKSRSSRFDSSYLLCKEKDGSTIVVWYESKANIAEKTELCALLGIKNVYVLK